MLIEELRVKISAEMGSLENVLNSIKSDMKVLGQKCSETESQVKNMSKSATSGMNNVSTATKGTKQSIESVTQACKDFNSAMRTMSGQKGQIFEIDTRQNQKDIKDLEGTLTNLEKEYDSLSQKANDMFLNDEHISNNDGYQRVIARLAEINGSIPTVETSIKKLKAELTFNDGGKKIFNTTKELEDLKQKALYAKEELDEANKKLKMMAAQKIDFGSDEMFEQQQVVSELTTKYQALKGQILAGQKELSAGTGYKSNFMTALTKEYPQVQAAITNLKANIKELWSAFKETKAGSFLSGFMSAIGVAKKLIVGLGKDVGAVVSYVGPAVGKVGSLIAQGFGKGVTAISAITAKAGELMSKMNPLTAICKKLGKSFSTLGSKIKTAFIYSAVNSFFRDIKDRVTSWLSSNEQMKSSLAQLKGAWTTAFAPAVQAVIPILQKICAWATAAASAFAQLISLLTGQAVSTFKATAAGMENAANASDEMGASAGGAGDAAEEAQKQLAGFDELEVMDDKNKSSGGGGGADASTEAANSLADLLDGKKFNSWGEAFSSLLDGIISKIPAFDSALQTLANKINWFSSNLLEMFSFPGVLEKVSTLAKGIANAFNHMFETIDWNQLGQALGAGLNLALQFIKDILYTFDWTALGSDLASAINGMIERIDFTNLGAILVSKFNIIWQTIYGFVSTLDWKQVGLKLAETIRGMIENIDFASCAKSLSDGIKGIATAVETCFDNLDVEQAKAKIKEFFENIDWAGMIESVVSALTSAVEVLVPVAGEVIQQVLNAVFKIITETDWGQVIEDLCDSIAKALEGADIGGILKSLGALIVTLAAAIPDLVMSALSGISNILASIFRSLGWDGIAGFFEGISEKLSGVADWLRTNLFEPVVNAVKDLFGIHSPSTVFNGFGQDLIAGLLKGISSTWGTIKDFFSTNFSNLKKLCSDTWENIKSKATTAWDNIKTKVSDRAETAKENINKSWENMKSKVNTTNENLKTYLQTSWDTLKSNLTSKTSTLKSTIESNWNTMKSNLTTYTSNLQTTLSNTWETMKSNIQTKTNTLKTDVETKWNTLKTNVSNTCNTLKTNLNTTYETIRSEVSNKISSMRTSVESTINTLKTNVSTYTSSIKSTITTNMNTAKTNAVSAFTNMKTSISNVLEGLKTIVSNVFTWISNKVKAIWEKVNSARDAEDEDFDTGYVNSGPGATKMASGGVVTKPTLTWVGEYAGAATNPEIVTPQNLLTSIIDNSQNGLIDVWLQTTRQIIQTIENKDMDVRIDDSAIAGAVVRANTASIRRTGTPLLV